MKKTLKLLTGICGVMMTVTLASNAQIMLSNFEDGTLNGWNSWSGNPIAVVPAPAAGLGSYSMQMTVNNAYWGQIVLPSWANGGVNVANVNAKQEVYMDLFFSSANWLPTYAEVKVQWQTGGGTLGDQDGTISTTLNNIVKDAVTPVQINLGSLLPRDPTATWANMILFVQPGYDPAWGTYTAKVAIDNFQLVPEPSTAALLAFGIAGLLIRRRR